MRSHTLPGLISWAVLATVVASMLAGLPTAVGLARHLVDTERNADLVSLATFPFLASAFVIVGKRRVQGTEHALSSVVSASSSSEGDIAPCKTHRVHHPGRPTAPARPA